MSAGEADVWATPVVISLDTALSLYQSEAPVQEFSFLVPRSPSGALQVTGYPLGSFVPIEVAGSEFSFTGVVVEVDYRSSVVTVVI